MSVSFSKSAKENMRAAGMKHCEEAFEAGEKYALFEAFVLAAAGRQALPEWARGAFRKLQRQLQRGEVGDLNEAFGWKKKGELNKKARIEAARTSRYRQTIFLALWEARRNGKGMTVDTFDEIAGEVSVGRSMVQRVWTERKEELLRVSPGDPPGNHAYMVFDIWDE